MTILAVQYLESNPGTSIYIQQEVRSKLRAALDLMPIKLVLIGWEAPEPLIHICREEADEFGAKLFRWHPLLTGDGDFIPRPEWQTVGLRGEKVPGFRGMPEFTFVCPNRPAVQAAASAHLQQVLRLGLFDGIFLDRIRFPSPAANPAAWLACFCEACHEAAGEIGLDLAAVRDSLQKLLNRPDQIQDLVKLFFRHPDRTSSNPDLSVIDRFFRFRTTSVTNFVSKAANLIHGEGLEVGLDTFSPSLAYLVGQDLKSLNECGEWIKAMTYGHALGPSGLPFELAELADWLMKDMGMDERDAMNLLSTAVQQPLPETVGELRQRGVEPGVLQEEAERGRSCGVDCFLAGIELVDLPGVTNLTPPQIQADLHAFHDAGVDGLVFSWDLQLMPVKRLAMVAAELRANW